MNADGGCPALELRGLSKSFGGLAAVRGVTLTVMPGQRKAIIGHNGAGKTTLFNLITGILPASSGQVLLFGQDVTSWPSHRRTALGMARTFQKIRLFKHLSALDNVLAGFHVHAAIPAWQYVVHGPAFRQSRARCRDEAERLLAFMGLERRAHVEAGSLSYGERRMLEIARALATAPRLLMVDEPAAGLNAAEVDVLLQRIELLRRDGMTVVVVEHNMDLVMKVADRVLVMDYGQYLFEGTPAEVQANPAVIAAYLGADFQ